MFKSTGIVVAALVFSFLTAPCFAAVKKDDPAALLEKAVKAMGGPAAVDSVRSVELHGMSKRILPNGEEWALTTVSTIVFPDHYRQEATIPIGGTLITIATPAGAFLQTGEAGSVQLPETQKAEIMRTIRRNPVALLQRRKTLRPKIEGEGQIDQKPTIILHFDEDIGSTTLAVDKKTGQILQMKYPTIGGMDSKPVDMTITYSDYRPVGKLVYPHASIGEIAGKPVFSYHLEKIVVNGSVDQKLFTAASPAPEPAASSTQPPASPHPSPSMQHPAPPTEPAKPENVPPHPPMPN
jgi:hypothetical protein